MQYFLRLDKGDKGLKKRQSCRDGGSFNPSLRSSWRGQVSIGLLLAGSLAFAAQASAQALQFVEELHTGPHWMMHWKSPSYLGVDVGDVDQERSQALHLKEARGAEITVLDHDAPAGKVGLKLHDVILQVDEQAIQNAEQMKRLLHDAAPGKKLQLLVSRDGTQQTVQVQLADRKKMEEQAKQELDLAGVSSTGHNSFLSHGGSDVPGGFHLPGWGSSLNVGVMVEPLAPQTAEMLGLNSGIMIKSIARKSAADVSGLKRNDVILQIGGESVTTASDWERLLRSSEGKPVQVTILRDRVKQLVLLQVDGKRHKI